MKFINNTYYTMPNLSMYILVLRVLSQDEDSAKLHVAYISKTGHPIGLENIDIIKQNVTHWELVNSVPFVF